MKSSRQFRLAVSFFARKLSGNPPRSQSGDIASAPVSGRAKGMSS